MSTRFFVWAVRVLFIVALLVLSATYVQWAALLVVVAAIIAVNAIRKPRIEQ